MIPFNKSYFVVPNKLIAGEIPSSIEEQANKEKLLGIKNANIKAVINLMEADLFNRFEFFINTVLNILLF